MKRLAASLLHRYYLSEISMGATFSVDVGYFCFAVIEGKSVR